MQNTVTTDTLKANYIYAMEVIKSTADEFSSMKYHIVRNLQTLGGRQGIVLGRDDNEELVTLIDIKTSTDLRSALVFLSDYISNADTKTIKLSEKKIEAAYQALDYLQGILPRFSELLVSRIACRRFIKSVKHIQKEQSIPNSTMATVIQTFTPDAVSRLGLDERGRVEDVLRSSVRNFYKTRLRNLKDEEFEILEEMEEVINYVMERGFTRELNDWSRDILDYIKDLYTFADCYVEDGRISNGLRNRVDVLYDLNEKRHEKQEQIKLCEQDLRMYDAELVAAGFKVRDCF